MAGKDWAGIAKSQKSILANSKLDSRRAQGLLETLGVLVEREAESYAQNKACQSNVYHDVWNLTNLSLEPNFVISLAKPHSKSEESL